MVSDPFTEVTMFKRNFDHVIREVYFTHYKYVARPRAGAPLFALCCSPARSRSHPPRVPVFAVAGQ